MLKEIRQQPAALARTLSGAHPQLRRLQRALDRRPPRLIALVARGTSDNAALFGRYLLEITTGVPVTLSAPSITTLYGTCVYGPETLVVAISQSGESTDTNLVLEQSRARGALTLGITNERASSMAKIAEHVLLVRAEKEVSVAATKTYTGQMLLMYLLACALGGRIRIRDLERVPAAVEAALQLEPAIDALSERYRFMRHCVVVGRGLNYANAFELSLKLMETCYVVAERFSSADFLHGPIAMVEPSFPVFVFAPPDTTWPSVRETVRKLQGLHAEIVAITDKGNTEAKSIATRSMLLPGRLPETMTAIPYIVPAQILAACLARQKGLNPDQPRTLTKVTLTL